jgi:arginyl-tRNA synthetase
VNFPFSSILALGLHSLLVNRLQKAVLLEEKNYSSDESALLTQTVNINFSFQLGHRVNPTKIPLNRIKSNEQIGYVSAIAFKLAGQSQPLAMSIAQALTDRLNQTMEAAQVTIEPQSLDRIWQKFIIQAVDPGWIHLWLTDTGLAEWLQMLTQQQIYRNGTEQAIANAVDHRLNLSNSTSISDLLYTHARCCSLLRSAARQGLIQLAPPTSNTEPEAVLSTTLSADSSPISAAKIIDFRIIHPQPLPWLVEAGSTAQLKQSLSRHHPAERHLIEEFVLVLDELSDKNQGADQIEKLAHRLSHCFGDFNAACRIWGEVQQDHLALAQMRLGLVLITQKILQFLLYELGWEPPIEL